jgi:hypothetical protein
MIWTTEQVEAHLRTKVLGPWELARQVARTRAGRAEDASSDHRPGRQGARQGCHRLGSGHAAQHAFVKSLSDDFGKDGIPSMKPFEPHP